MTARHSLRSIYRRGRQSHPTGLGPFDNGQQHGYGPVDVDKDVDLVGEHNNPHSYGGVDAGMGLILTGFDNTHSYGAVDVEVESGIDVGPLSAFSNTSTYGAVEVDKDSDETGFDNTSTYGAVSVEVLTPLDAYTVVHWWKDEETSYTTITDYGFAELDLTMNAETGSTIDTTESPPFHGDGAATNAWGTSCSAQSSPNGVRNDDEIGSGGFDGEVDEDFTLILFRKVNEDDNSVGSGAVGHEYFRAFQIEDDAEPSLFAGIRVEGRWEDENYLIGVTLYEDDGASGTDLIEFGIDLDLINQYGTNPYGYWGAIAITHDIDAGDSAAGLSTLYWMREHGPVKIAEYHHDNPLRAFGLGGATIDTDESEFWRGVYNPESGTTQDLDGEWMHDIWIQQHLTQAQVEEIFEYIAGMVPWTEPSAPDTQAMITTVTTSGGTGELPIPAMYGVGDLIILGLGNGGTQDAGDDEGINDADWYEVLEWELNGFGATLGVYAKIVTQALLDEGTVTVTDDSGDCDYIGHWYRIGAGEFYQSSDLSDVIETNTVADTNGATSPPSGQVTPSWGDDEYARCFAFCGVDWPSFIDWYPDHPVSGDFEIELGLNTRLGSVSYADIDEDYGPTSSWGVDSNDGARNVTIAVRGAVPVPRDVEDVAPDVFPYLGLGSGLGGGSLWTNLIFAHWSLDEASGPFVCNYGDEEGATAAITNSGDVTLEVAPLCRGTGKAVTFGGTNGYATLGATDDYDWIHRTGVFVISFWLRPEAIGSTEHLMGNVWGSGNGFRCTIGSGGTLQFAMRCGGSFPYVESSTVLVAGEPVHVCITSDGSTLRMFLDGEEEDTDSAATVASDSALPMTLGGVPGGSAYGNFTIDELTFRDGMTSSAGQAELVAKGFYFATKKGPVPEIPTQDWILETLQPSEWIDAQTSSMWQDTSGTTPAGDGDTVERIDDISGNGRHFINGDGTLTLDADGWNSELPTLVSSGGVDDNLVNASGGGTYVMSSPMTAFLAYKNDNANLRYLVSHGTGGSIHVLHASDAATGTGPGGYNPSDGHFAWGSATLTDEDVFAVEYDPNDKARLWQQNTQFGSDVDYTQWSIDSYTHLFGQSDAMDGHLSEYFATTIPPTPKQREGVIRYLKARWNK